MTFLQLGDADSAHDVATYLSRARALDADGAVRLTYDGATLAVYVGVLAGTGLLGEGTVVGLRVFALAPAARVPPAQPASTSGAARSGQPPETDAPRPAAGDAVVSIASVLDRLARRGVDPCLVDIPAVTVRAGWAALAPPRSGWEPVGEVASTVLEDAARGGISAIATGAPQGSGGKAVEAVRRSVWSRPVPELAQISAGSAFAAYALGFLAGGSHAAVLRCGRWTRLSLPAGHVLAR